MEPALKCRLEHMLQDGETETHGVEQEICTSTMGWEMHGESPPCEANNLLATTDADDGPCEALPPHGSTTRSSEHVEALAPWLRRQVDDVDPQECGESPAHDACDALGACGELQTHTPSDAMQ